MSDRDWSRYAAVVGAGILAVVLTWSITLSYCKDVGCRAEAASGDRVGRGQPAVIGQQALQGEAQQRAATQLDQADLNVQRGMAGAAWAQAGISFAALIGLGLTVFYARKAWKESRQQATIAKNALQDARDAAAGQESKFAVQLAAAQAAADAAKRSADIAERSLTMVERAAISLTGFRNDAIYSGEKLVGYRIMARLKNAGRSRATRCIIVANSLIDVAAIPKDYDFPDRVESAEDPFILAPGEETFSPLPFSVDDLRAIQNGAKHATLYGWIEYRDIFGQLRRTEWSVVLTVIGDIMQPAPDNTIFELVARGNYNADDEDCRYKPGTRPPVRADVLAPWRKSR